MQEQYKTHLPTQHLKKYFILHVDNTTLNKVFTNTTPIK